MARPAPGEQQRRRRAVADAALVLAAALLALVALRAPSGSEAWAPPCPHPLERVARDGRTWAVRCTDVRQAGRALRGPARLLFGLPLDLNREDARSLESLPGIGPERARAIVEARPHASLDALVRVHGIGPRTVEGLRGWAVAGGSGP